jgi:tetratricopeptide (TPR) repeat protein
MKKTFLYIFILTLLGSACKEDFLVQEPHQLSELSYYTSEQGAEEGLNATYSIMGLGQTITHTEFSGSVCSGDAMTGGEPGGSTPPLQEIMRFQTIASNGLVQKYWTAVYRGIYRANLLIQYLKEPLNTIKEEKRKKILGEAYFLRGLYHFKLQTMYGGFPQLQQDFDNKLKGIPFLDHVLTDAEWKSVERPTMEETWDAIVNDFISASALLPEYKDQAPGDYGHATKGAADAMLAKSYLYQNKFAEAYAAAQTVIESGNYYLVGDNEHPGPFTVTRTAKDGEVQVKMPGYKWIWQPEANNCPEEIFSVQHFAEMSPAWPEGQQGNIQPQYYGVRRVWTFTAPGDSVSTEYFWGYMLPTSYFIETAYKDVGCEPTEGDIKDPRYKLTVIRNNDLVPFRYGSSAARLAYPDSARFDGWYNMPCTGNATWKYFTDPIFLLSRPSLGTHPQNTKYLRYADLLLMASEAAFQLGNFDKALEYINKVRERARNSGNTGYPLAYTLSELTLDKIYAERRVELAFEGHQFYDLVRTRRAKQVLTVDAMVYQKTTSALGVESTQEFGDNFTPGKNEIWPISEAEIDLISNSGFTQNPGY